jgi:very-short-patch-repair endonuclease
MTADWFLRAAGTIPTASPEVSFNLREGSMLFVPPALARWFHDHYGVVDTATLNDLEVSRHDRGRLVAADVLRPLHQGVYHFTAVPLTLEGKALGACMANARAVICSATAGRLWTLRGIRDTRLHVAVPLGANPFATGAVVHRTGMMPPEDIVVRPDGIRVTSPPRTLFDLAASLDEAQLESAIEQVLDRECCTIPTLHAVGRRMGSPGRAGSGRFAAVLASRPAYLKPAQSDLEVRLYDSLRQAGLAGLVRQHRLRLPSGVIVKLDIANVEARWGVEIDHVTWHGGRADAQRDKARDRACRRLGWQVERVTDAEIDHHLGPVTAELVELATMRQQEVSRVA